VEKKWITNAVKLTESAMKHIKIAETDEEILKCFPVVAELRPYFTSNNDFLTQVKRQMSQSNFRLVYLEENGVKAGGGIRIAEWLGGGKYLEIEDLVATENERSKGYGGELFDWIVDYAKSENCDQIKLVSHVKRFGAHKFYLNKGMIIEAHYFSMTL
jgi:GNAT superfamily N-acetyltransferase